MPFKSNSAMEQKHSFIRDYLTDQYIFSSLCEAYGISRQGGYDLVKRYEAEGEDCFLPRSKRPLSNPNATPQWMIDRILFWRRRKKKNRWGAKKIRVKLLEEYEENAVPSVTTIHNILIREGEVKVRKRKQRLEAQAPVFDPEECNEIWSVDHKGKFYLGNGRRCSPLTVCDSKSRYLFLAKGQYRETYLDTRKELEKVFREFGLPEYLHTDNGSVFASSQSPRGFGQLSYWLLDLGIVPLFSDPGCPSQNGRHERMHRDLKAECCSPARKDLRSQNRWMNEFSEEYNEIRPHEALGQQTPSSVHEFSLRSYPAKIEEPVYGSEMMTRKVASNGVLRWKSHEYVTVSRALAGKYIGVKPLPGRVYEIYYRGECLGYFQEGEQVERGRYYLLNSDRHLPERYRDRGIRRRK